MLCNIIEGAKCEDLLSYDQCQTVKTFCALSCGGCDTTISSSTVIEATTTTTPPTTTMMTPTATGATTTMAPTTTTTATTTTEGNVNSCKCNA